MQRGIAIAGLGRLSSLRRKQSESGAGSDRIGKRRRKRSSRENEKRLSGGTEATCQDRDRGETKATSDRIGETRERPMSGAGIAIEQLREIMQRRRVRASDRIGENEEHCRGSDKRSRIGKRASLRVPGWQSGNLGRLSARQVAWIADRESGRTSGLSGRKKRHNRVSEAVRSGRRKRPVRCLRHSIRSGRRSSLIRCLSNGRIREKRAA